MKCWIDKDKYTKRDKEKKKKKTRSKRIWRGMMCRPCRSRRRCVGLAFLVQVLNIEQKRKVLGEEREG